MSSIELNQIPGLAKNLARVKRVEDSWREKAFLPVGVTINGVDVLQMTLRHMTILMELRNPFVWGGIQKPEHVGEFLWVLSPHYNPGDKGHDEKRREFLTQLVANYPREKFLIFYRAIHRYVWVRALMDIPPVAVGRARRSIATCFAAGMINRIAATYHWGPDQIMAPPIAALYQLWKWIEAENSVEDKPQFNPLQDRVTQYYFDRYTEAQKAHG